MRTIQTTPKGYYYAEVNRIECLAWGGLGDCDLCGKPFAKGYLVPVLSGCICPDCFNSWLKREVAYQEDLYTQDQIAESYFKNYLGKNIIMPADYCDRKIEELAKENEKLLKDIDKLNAKIDMELKDVFPELGGDFDESE